MSEAARRARPMSLLELNRRLHTRSAEQRRGYQDARLLWPLACLAAHGLGAGVAFAGLTLCALVLPSILSSGGPLQLLGTATAAALFSIFGGTRLRALGNIQHECAHRTFVSWPRLNDGLGLGIGIILFQPFFRYRKAHITHHRFLGDPVRDLDLNRYEKNLTLYPEAQTVVQQLEMATQPKHFRVGLSLSLKDSLDPDWCNRLRMAHLACTCLAATALIFHDHLLTVLLFALPILIVYPLLCVWSDIADHAVGYRTAPDSNERPRVDMFALTRNHLFGSELLNKIFFPRNDSYHLLHHLYPSLPTGAFPQAHAILIRNDPHYAGMDHTLRIFYPNDKRYGHKR
jgi:fatty acid desaturase